MRNCLAIDLGTGFSCRFIVSFIHSRSLSLIILSWSALWWIWSLSWEPMYVMWKYTPGVPGPSQHLYLYNATGNLMDISHLLPFACQYQKESACSDTFMKIQRKYNCWKGHLTRGSGSQRGYTGVFSTTPNQDMSNNQKIFSSTNKAWT